MHTDKITEDILSAIKNNKLKLPTQPEIALQIRQCAENDNVDAIKLAKIINKDLGLTAKFMQMANSVSVRGVVPIDSLPSAIHRLGFTFVCDTATGLAMQQMFQAKNEIIDKMMHDTWQCSGYVAACSLAISKRFTRIPPEKASLAGLMHQIGILPILTYAQENEALLNNPETLKTIIQEHHAKVGEFILNSWKFPGEIAQLPTRLSEPDAIEDRDIQLKDILKLSIHYAKQNGKYLYNMDYPMADIYKKFNVDEEKLSHDEKFITDLENAVGIYCQH